MAAVSGKRKRNKINKDNAGYFFIAPYFIVFLTFTLYPILYTFKLSFMSWDGFGEQQFIGLANYQRLLQDQMFIKSIGNTIFIALLAMIPQMVFGLVLAFLLNQKKLRGSNFFKTVFYFPNLVTAVSLGVLFSLLFDWKAGSVNQVLMTLHIIKDPINWKGSPLLSQLIVALVLFWQYFGYYTIIFTAGIRGIPYELFEAAEVDGASKVQTFFKIGCWNSYVQPSILLFSQEKFTLPILVQQMQGVYKTDYGVVYLGVTLSVVPILLLFMFCSKKILESSMSGAVKG